MLVVDGRTGSDGPSSIPEHVARTLLDGLCRR